MHLFFPSFFINRVLLFYSCLGYHLVLNLNSCGTEIPKPYIYACEKVLLIITNLNNNKIKCLVIQVY